MRINIEKIMDILNQKLFEKDLRSIAMWLNVESITHLDINLTKMKISDFSIQIDEMEKSYINFPKEKERTLKIYNKIKNGETPQPIFIEKDDENKFIMEGRHRIVAFKWLGLEEIVVAKVNKKDFKSKPKFKLA